MGTAGGNTLLISKYNPDAMEWSLLEPLPRNTGARKDQVLRFGGAGTWKMGDPEGAASLKPGASFTFGATRYKALDGGWKDAYYEFRHYTERLGNRIPAGYNPPVHWNELYDNRLWWIGDNLENRQKYYRRADMEAEAKNAKDLGCECLYLDPGWDNSFGSGIWADDRLGGEAEFVAWLKKTYGLSLALHMPLAPWSSPDTYPSGTLTTDAQGNSHDQCCSSEAYIEAKIERCKEACRGGAYYLMFDGGWFEDCYNPDHGHSVPLTHQEHIDSILRITEEVHKAYPKVMIEQHDPMTSGSPRRYTPTYLMYAKRGAFNELWGYEYMWDPRNCIINHQAFSLYYVNMAYAIPIYLHIDLRLDNINALAFWWYASTCRHLGVGGKSSDPALWEAQKQAMRTYLANKRFFTQGIFYGLGEETHAHTLPDIGECLVNCFNLSTQPTQKEVRFKFSDIGLAPGPVRVEGASFSVDGDEVVFKVWIPARGHRLVKVIRE